MESDGGNTREPATISTFRLDEYLVTVGRFRQFVQAWNGGAGYLPAVGSGRHAYLNGGSGLENVGEGGGYELGWQASSDMQVAPTNANLACDKFSTWTPSAGAQESLPVNCVNWYEAYAFCIWDGGFLPSQTEWEYARVGGGGPEGQRAFPWGDGPAPGMDSQYAILGCFYRGSGLCTGVENVAPVGTAPRGAGRWGQLDLVGDMNQWVLDYSGDYTGPCTNCVSLTPSVNDILEGCAFDSILPYYGDYTYEEPIGRAHINGIRCARSPE
jgi:formylglycine-generating enzyme required for sulfatase activity